MEKAKDAEHAICALQKVNDKLLVVIAKAEELKGDDKVGCAALLDEARDVKVEAVDTLDAATLAKKKLTNFLGSL